MNNSVKKNHPVEKGSL